MQNGRNKLVLKLHDHRGKNFKGAESSPFAQGVVNMLLSMQSGSSQSQTQQEDVLKIHHIFICINKKTNFQKINE